MKEGASFLVYSLIMFFSRQFMNKQESQFLKGGEIGGFNTNNFG